MIKKEEFTNAYCAVGHIVTSKTPADKDVGDLIELTCPYCGDILHVVIQEEENDKLDMIELGEHGG